MTVRKKKAIFTAYLIMISIDCKQAFKTQASILPPYSPLPDLSYRSHTHGWNSGGDIMILSIAGSRSRPRPRPGPLPTGRTRPRHDVLTLAGLLISIYYSC